MISEVRVAYFWFAITFLPPYVHGSSCGNGETYQTITNPCSQVVAMSQMRVQFIPIKPNCNFWEDIWSSEKCKTRYRTEYSTVIVNKTVTRLCSSVVCCPGFSLSNGTCESGCIDGVYGENCTKNCSCPDNAYRRCERNTGKCTCKAGFRGANCTEACPGGYFGDNCLFACSCKNNATCDRVTGHCNCTEPGWSGSFCDKRCNGTFGLYCSEQCVCNQNESCDPSNGNCMCKPGRTGENCSKDCDFQRYGSDCKNVCNCTGEKWNGSCDARTGDCHCISAFQGDICYMEQYRFGNTDKQEQEKDTTNMTFIVAVIAGSCGGLAIIIFLTIGVVVRHRRKQKRIERSKVKTSNCAKDENTPEQTVCNDYRLPTEESNIYYSNPIDDASLQCKMDVTDTKTGDVIYSNSEFPELKECALLEVESDNRNHIKSENQLAVDSSLLNNKIISLHNDDRIEREHYNEVESVISENVNISNQDTKEKEHSFLSLNKSMDTIVNQESSDKDQYDRIQNNMKASVRQKSSDKGQYDRIHNNMKASVSQEKSDKEQYDRIHNNMKASVSQEKSDKERYDSLQNSMKAGVKKMVSLPNYCSFEQVRQERLHLNHGKSDEINSTSQNDRSKVRNTYNTLDNIKNEKKNNWNDFVNCNSDEGHNQELASPMTSISNAVNISGEENNLTKITDYGTLNHTGNSFCLHSLPTNLATDEAVCPNTMNLKISSSVRNDDDHNKLNHTGMSLRQVNHSIHSTKEIKPDTNSNTSYAIDNKCQTAEDNGDRLYYQNKVNNDNLAKTEFQHCHHKDSGTKTVNSIISYNVMNDGDYDKLDHTGKYSLPLSTSNDIYHTNEMVSQIDRSSKNLLEDSQITEAVEENSYYQIVDEIKDENVYESEDGQCHYENPDIQIERSEMNDDQCIYEIPDTSDNTSDARETCNSINMNSF